MRTKIFVAGLIVALIAGGGYYLQMAGTSPQADTSIADNLVVPEFSPTALRGQKIFNVKCSACHGKNAVGTDNGPPFIHRFYRPGHHGDEAFQRAAANGVKSHHWKFGDMPPVAGITRGDIKPVIVYVRELQRANGIK